ncbi:hypothetical protein BDM02DRAFT_3193963 [Thelephora ganbajun]|uniref:Uncharacterized protein n=1 Tax=Thelephora ganbajun TaxID=370292 RepID=A0ACB6YX73_THEGA|nr:hypothetical protein BDM02DRAFT_3193963 [Thelephora ganbajun]
MSLQDNKVFVSPHNQKITQLDTQPRVKDSYGLDTTSPAQCQATLAQLLTGTNEVCKAPSEDTHLWCLLVPILLRVSVSSSDRQERGVFG